MITDADFRVLLDRYQRSWKGFKKVRKSPMRRIGKHMELLGCSSIEQYLDLLDDNRPEKEVLLGILRITISCFFRDRGLWSSLTNSVFPTLLKQHDTLEIWSAGCCCGEEVYSLKILHELHWASCSSLKILATDVNDICLERAQKGIYQKSSLRELEASIISTCFHPSDNQNEFILNQGFKKGITWKHHDFFSTLPGKNFHVVFLRNNLLTYHSRNVQSTVLGRILSSLHTGGFLVIGCHESLPTQQEMNLIPTTCSMIYQLHKAE